MYNTIKINATLKEEQRNVDKNMYLCTFRGKPLMSASKHVQFECSVGTKITDLSKFLNEGELEEIVITFPTKPKDASVIRNRTPKE